MVINLQLTSQLKLMILASVRVAFY
ncbi:hypothetical protein [Latilactobacillus phage TMW 1.1447 P1]|nr:hypothetical protein [Latilactobacillus phage TMW 1.1447 P1]